MRERCGRARSRPRPSIGALPLYIARQDPLVTVANAQMLRTPVIAIRLVLVFARVERHDASALEKKRDVKLQARVSPDPAGSDVTPRAGVYADPQRFPPPGISLGLFVKSAGARFASVGRNVLDAGP